MIAPTWSAHIVVSASDVWLEALPPTDDDAAPGGIAVDVHIEPLPATSVQPPPSSSPRPSGQSPDSDVSPSPSASVSLSPSPFPSASPSPSGAPSVSAPGQSGETDGPTGLGLDPILILAVAGALVLAAALTLLFLAARRR